MEIETIEEAAERISESCKLDRHEIEPFINGFIECAKWKSEKSYSEVEIEILLETLSKVLVYQGNEYKLPNYFENEIKQTVEKFKKLQQE